MTRLVLHIRDSSSGLDRYDKEVKFSWLDWNYIYGTVLQDSIGTVKKWSFSWLDWYYIYGMVLQDSIGTVKRFFMTRLVLHIRDSSSGLDRYDKEVKFFMTRLVLHIRDSSSGLDRYDKGVKILQDFISTAKKWSVFIIRLVLHTRRFNRARLIRQTSECFSGLDCYCIYEKVIPGLTGTTNNWRFVHDSTSITDIWDILQDSTGVRNAWRFFRTSLGRQTCEGSSRLKMLQISESSSRFNWYYRVYVNRM
jgi:hypothetical protein